MNKHYFVLFFLIVIVINCSCRNEVPSSQTESVNSALSSQNDTSSVSLFSQPDFSYIDDHEYAGFIRYMEPEIQELKDHLSPQFFTEDDALFHEEFMHYVNWLSMQHLSDNKDIVCLNPAAGELQIKCSVDNYTYSAERPVARCQYSEQYIGFLSHSDYGPNWFEVYENKDTFSTPIFAYKPEEGLNVQSFQFFQDSVFWVEATYIASPDGIPSTFWRFCQGEIESGNVTVLLTSEETTNAFWPCFVFSEKSLYLQLLYPENYGEICEYDFTEHMLRHLYYQNCISFSYFGLRYANGTLISYDYDGNSFYLDLYTPSEGVCRQVKIFLRYKSEYVETAINCGDWLMYSSSFGLVYGYNMKTGEIRYISDRGNLYPVSDHLALLARIGETSCIYDFEADRYREITEVTTHSMDPNALVPGALYSSNGTSFLIYGSNRRTDQTWEVPLYFFRFEH